MEDGKYELIPNTDNSPNPTFAAMLRELPVGHPVRQLHGLGHVDDLMSDGPRESMVEDLPEAPIEPTAVFDPKTQIDLGRRKRAPRKSAAPKKSRPPLNLPPKSSHRITEVD